MTRVLIVGGSGAFGARIAERLAKTSDFELVIAGRNEDRAKDAAARLRDQFSAKATAVQLDSLTVRPGRLEAIGASVIINASGPFQDHNTRLIEAAITNQNHYIDLADARSFVINIEKFDQRAKDAGVLVVSGASTVPGLSSTVLCHLAKDMTTLDSVEIGISPGNHFDPGVATTRSVLKGLGQPIVTTRSSTQDIIYGWQNLSRKSFGDLGNRWLSNVDVPDLELIPKHFPEVEDVSFQAGTELTIQHLGLWGLSWLARAKLLRRAEQLTPALLALKRLTHGFGSNCGGMRLSVSGRDHQDQRIKKLWTLAARDGHGPFIPALASVILTKTLATGGTKHRGACPCFNLFSYTAFQNEIDELSITCTIERAVR